MNACAVLFAIALFVIVGLSLSGNRGAARGCGGLMALVIALAASAATIGLITVGNRNHWSSDGPGMLFIMIGVLVCGGVALSAFAALLGVLGASTPGEPDRDPRSRIKF